MKRIDETISKRCTKCDEIKLSNEFLRAKKRKDGTWQLQAQCRECKKKYLKNYYHTRSDKMAEKWLKLAGEVRERKKHDRLFVIELALGKMRSRNARSGVPCNTDPKEILEAFTGKCYVCGVPEVECQIRLNIDHDHKTGRFRGWLCRKCNVAVGYLSDNKEVILRLAEYIEQAEVASNG